MVTQHSVRNCSNLPDAFKIASPAANLQDRNKHRSHNHEEKKSAAPIVIEGWKSLQSSQSSIPCPELLFRLCVGARGYCPQPSTAHLLCAAHTTQTNSVRWESRCFINCLLSYWAGKGRACFVLKETTKFGVIKLLELTMLSVSHCLASYKTQLKI